MSFGLMPIGVFPMAFIADAIGIDVALLLGAIALAVATMVVGVLMPSVRRIDRGTGEEESLSEPVAVPSVQPQPELVRRGDG